MRILKLWVKRRGIYHYNFGYLNGITIAIMLTYIQRNHKQDLEEQERNIEDLFQTKLYLKADNSKTDSK